MSRVGKGIARKQNQQQFRFNTFEIFAAIYLSTQQRVQAVLHNVPD